MRTLYFTVTNDLNFDQRMIRICGTLADQGYRVFLVGRQLPDSPSLVQRTFHQKRLKCLFNKGKLFYLEFNIRLFLFLLTRKIDLICAIDLDTILPCLFISRLKSIPRVYDAHELFCEMKEVVSRPGVYRIWKRIERYSVPRFRKGYTVSSPISDQFRKEYGVDYALIRNFPSGRSDELVHPPGQGYILYQGAVNEGRSLETLIPAFRDIELPLLIYGDGNFMDQARKIIADSKLEEKVFLRGKVDPEILKGITSGAFLGITLFEKKGLSNYYSLANRFFDYIQAGIPQLCVDYPAYREINQKYEVALLISDLSIENISLQVNKLIQDKVLYKRLQENTLLAAHELNWDKESEKLIQFYSMILPSA